MSAFPYSLGWGPDLEAAMAPHRDKGLAPARVCLVYRKQLRLLAEDGERWARTGGKLMHHADNAGELPVVGDWVAARIPPQGEALVHAVLPRRTSFVRKAPGDSAVPHVLATNVDSVLVVMGLDQDFSVPRLERFLTLAFESGATPIVVLNKADVAEDLDRQVEEVRAVAQGVAVHVVTAAEGKGLEPLAELARAGQTVVLLGSSGVGKSTLVNRLAGAVVMETGSTKDDGKGRHTTTRRELLVLPRGGAVIDTPGLREVQMWAASEGLRSAFDDIEALAQRCRFSDCHHDAEPGCAVHAAVESGELEPRRFASWVELRKEMEWLGAPAATRGRPASKRRDRVGHGVRKR